MKVAVISDIHENFHNLTLFMEMIKGMGVEKIVFLGDFMNNGIAKVLASSSVPVFAIWGNNDGDKVAITKTSMQENSNLEVGFDTFDFLDIDDRKVFVTHYPLLAKPMAKSGDFDAVFYGHNHKKNIDRVNDCIVVNPGEISAHKTSEASFAVYDSSDNSAELFVVENSVSVKTEKSDEILKKLRFEFSRSKTHEYK